MNISKELFNKLDKKKQEEFKSKIDKVKEIKLLVLWSTYGFWMIYFIAFMFIAIPLWKIAFGLLVIKPLFVLLISGIRILAVAMIVGLYIDLGILIIKLYKINQIKKEYFKVDIK